MNEERKKQRSPGSSYLNERKSFELHLKKGPSTPPPPVGMPTDPNKLQALANREYMLSRRVRVAKDLQRQLHVASSSEKSFPGPQLSKDDKITPHPSLNVNMVNVENKRIMKKG